MHPLHFVLWCFHRLHLLSHTCTLFESNSKCHLTPLPLLRLFLSRTLPHRQFLVPTHLHGFSIKCTSQATGFLLMTISVFIITSTSAMDILGMRYVAKLDSSLVKMKLDPALRKMSQNRHGRSRGHWLAHALIPQWVWSADLQMLLRLLPMAMILFTKAWILLLYPFNLN